MTTRMFLLISLCSTLLTTLPAKPAKQKSNTAPILQEWRSLIQNARGQNARTATDAAGGVDGIKNGNYGFHTTNQKTPTWWQVDLTETQALDHVLIFNRISVPDRALTVCVMLSLDDNTWKEIYRHDGTLFLGIEKQPLNVALKGEKARFVRLQLPDGNYLHLDEIEVYGTANPNLNIALRQPALQSSVYGSAPKATIVDTKPFGPEDTQAALQTLTETLASTGQAGAALRQKGTELAQVPFDKTTETKWLALYAEAKKMNSQFGQALRVIEHFDTEALRRAIKDLGHTWPDEYPNAEKHLATIEAFEREFPDLLKGMQQGDEKSVTRVAQFETMRRQALMENPLLNFDQLLLVKRAEGNLGLPRNWQGNCALPKTGYDNEVAILSPIAPEGELKTVFRPEKSFFVGDVDLHFDADRILFSMPGNHNRWQVWETGLDGTGLRQVTPGTHPDVDNYDPCYLPDGRIIFASTRFFQGVPCVDGNDAVANLCLMSADGSGIRQLCFDQDHNWSPTLLPNGRILYTRWEYADLPHSNSRLMFQMNPDGTSQMEYYASNSIWPNGVFYARPIPEPSTQSNTSKFVGIVTGHHGVARMGELVLFDPSISRRSESGVIQRIPGFGKKVEPVYRDQLVNDSWPKFLHPYPLSDKYFIVSAQPSPNDSWGIYLVDVFDNLLLLKETPGYVLFEPLPLRKTEKPPVIPDRVDLARKDALIYVSDIYQGPGLKGVPRGEVKNLRVITYVYGYQGMGGLLGVIGMDGPWDVRRILGTVPVQEDGSALFRVPANMPIAIQPLDGEGKAIQLMRSWMTAMPGEVLSCGGCHEGQNTAASARPTIASRTKPSEIEPWHGPARGFSYAREVQPVIDRRCLACHDGNLRDDGKSIPNLRGDMQLTDWKSVTPGQGARLGGQFSVGYAELHRFVRRPGIESDYHLLNPLEFHADTTELVQMLRKGHHGVQLDTEDWDRIVTWIDLNAPYHGAWSEIDAPAKVAHMAKRRMEISKLYRDTMGDPEALPALAVERPRPIMPTVQTRPPAPPTQCEGWPFSAQEAARRQNALGQTHRTIRVTPDFGLKMALVPAGSFVMGSATGAPDEWPPHIANIDKAFWVGQFEISNAQFAEFDPTHDSHVESKHAYQFGVHGFPVNEPNQPVVRISWQQAVDFCAWLSAKTGEQFSLPTETQWEWACRAGSEKAFSYGDIDADFSKIENMGDASLTRFADDPYSVGKPLLNPTKYDDWIPKDARFNDGVLVSAEVGKYAGNAWGLHDMHGNVAEWTQSDYRPYDGTKIGETRTLKVARGGSWYDRPMRSTSSYRTGYRSWQKVFNVGFRVVCPSVGTGTTVADNAK